MNSSTKLRSQINARKAMGVHYTPPLLGQFLAERVVQRVKNVSEPLRILDPACGDGGLLEATLNALQKAHANRYEVCGVETDKHALAVARSRLLRFNPNYCRLIPQDFLELSGGSTGQRSLWEKSSEPYLERIFDIVIANPPYVRTQILGAIQAQRLAARFGLTGRVDLYHAFLVAATEALRPGGVIGVIISNRFLSTLGGAGIRGYLAQQYEIDEVIDLGDTKFFEAAVLPAIFIGRRRGATVPQQTPQRARFIKIYSQGQESSEKLETSQPEDTLFDVLKRGEPGSYRVPQGVFVLTCGDLHIERDTKQVWSLVTPQEVTWLQQIRAGACGLFRDIATVRVGIKTTADEVFIRSDWNLLPASVQPEPELLHPLLRHEDARRWILPEGIRPATAILYPHEMANGRRRAIDLQRYPRAEAYLQLYKERLERRRYVAEAGRHWYEIWVPQDPDSWRGPKIVFPDISPEPRFYLDFGGHLVDGDCYWITLLPGVPSDVLYLLLGVANSRLMSRYHDLAFNNKLYSGRRRYITQYVSKYPHPPLDSFASRKLIAFIKHLVRDLRAHYSSSEGPLVDREMNSLVEEAFGLEPHKTAE